MTDPQDSLQLGIAAYKAGQKETARAHLLKAVREQPDSEQAWGWLSNTAQKPEERIYCLRQVVRINPANSSAAKLLKELEGNDWLAAGPPAAVPEKASVSPPPTSPGISTPAVRTPAGSDSVQTILVVLLVVMVLFWLGVGLLQLFFSLDPNESTFDLLCFGGGNIVFSIINGSLIVPTANRKKSVLQSLYFLAGLGSAVGMLQLLFGSAYLQICAIPLYILLGILAYANREAFVH